MKMLYPGDNPSARGLGVLPFLVKLFALAVCLNIVCWVVAGRTIYLRRFASNSIVYAAIHRSQQVCTNASVIVLGDSVCAQIYDPRVRQEPIVSLASNYGVSMIGQRILLEEWFKSNPGNRKGMVVLLMIPSSFGNTLDGEFTYSNLIKPFWRSEWRDRFDEEEQGWIKAFPYYWISQIPCVVLSNWCPPRWPKFSKKTDRPKNPIAQVSVKEIRRISGLAQEHGMSFVIKASVSRESSRGLDYKAMQSQIASEHLDEWFRGYFDSIQYLPDRDFRDKIHLSNPSMLGRDPLKLGKLGNQ